MNHCTPGLLEGVQITRTSSSNEARAPQNDGLSCARWSVPSRADRGRGPTPRGLHGRTTRGLRRWASSLIDESDEAYNLAVHGVPSVHRKGVRRSLSCRLPPQERAGRRHWIGEDESSRRPAIVKTVPAATLSAQRTAPPPAAGQGAGELSSPFLASPLQIGIDDGLVYAALPFVHGVTLKSGCGPARLPSATPSVWAAGS